LNKRPTDLVAVVKEVVAEQQLTTQRHRLIVESELPELTGSWDASRLIRAVTNLLTNAIRYSPHGGEIVVTISRDEGEHGADAVLTVSDQGLGIPEADLPHIFERFYRGANVAAQVSGTGVGLAGVRQIVEQHGGSIGVQSVEGEGATFVV